MTLSLNTSISLAPLQGGVSVADQLPKLPGMQPGSPGAIADVISKLPGLQGPGAAADLISRLIGPGAAPSPIDPPVYGRPVEDNGPVYGRPVEDNGPVYGRPVEDNGPVYGRPVEDNGPVYGRPVPCDLHVHPDLADRATQR